MLAVIFVFALLSIYYYEYKEITRENSKNSYDSYDTDEAERSASNLTMTKFPEDNALGLNIYGAYEDKLANIRKTHTNGVANLGYST